MESFSIIFIVLLSVVFASRERNSEEQVEMRVRPGDDVTLYSDCSWTPGLDVVWFRNCSHSSQPPFIYLNVDFETSDYQPRYLYVWNPSNGTYDLRIRAVTEADLGVYYCALHEKKYTKECNVCLSSLDSYRYARTFTRLSFLEEARPRLIESLNATAAGDPGRCVSWEVWVGVCTVCVLLSSVISSGCVYCLCRNTEDCERTGLLLSENDFQVSFNGAHRCEKTMKGEICDHTTVCYTALKPATGSRST